MPKQNKKYVTKKLQKLSIVTGTRVTRLVMVEKMHMIKEIFNDVLNPEGKLI